MPIGDSPLRSLRTRSFATYWAAQTLSVVGDYAFMVALAIRLAVVQHRPGLLAVVLTANVGIRIPLLLVGGVVADRFGARRTVIAGDALQALAIAMLGIAYLAGDDTAAAYVGCGALLGAGYALFAPAYGVVIPDMVPADDLASANSVRLGGEVCAAVVGPPIGGLLVTVGGFGWVLAAETVTFAVAVLAAFAVVPRLAGRSTGREDAGGSLLGDARKGLHHALRTPFILRGVTFLACVTLAIDGPHDVLLPGHAASADGLGLGTGGYAWLTTASGAGALAGAAWWGRRETPSGSRARTLGLCYVIWGAGFSVCGGSIGSLAIAGMVVAGFGVAGEDVVWYTAVQRATPRAMLGRTLAFSDLASLSTKPVSYALAGLVAGRVPAGGVIFAGGAATVLVGVTVLRGALRSLD